MFSERFWELLEAYVKTAADYGINMLSVRQHVRVPARLPADGVQLFRHGGQTAGDALHLALPGRREPFSAPGTEI